MTIVISNTDFLNGDVLDGQTTDNPIVFYKSFYQLADISSSNVSTTNPASNAWNPDTYSIWEGTGLSPGAPTLHQEYLVIENSTNQPFDYVAISGHNLSDIRFDGGDLTLIIESSTDGIIYNTIDNAAFITNVTTNDPAVFYFDSNTDDYIRVLIEADNVESVSAPRIAHVKAGEATVLQRREFQNVASGYLSKTLRRTQNMSDNGQYLGQVVLSTKREMSLNQSNNTPQFVRDEIFPFIAHTEGEAQISGGSSTTFFYAWRPTSYPKDILYAWTMDKITPSHQGGDSWGGRMEWSFNMEALT